jgi:predicted RNase H-like HicB family nuclease
VNYEYDVIVHPAGLLDADGAGYWTEVPALPACIAEGQTVEEAVDRTRQTIVRWLSRQNGSAGDPAAGSGIQVSVNIIIAV